MAVKIRKGSEWVEVSSTSSGGITDVKQYSDNAATRTERTCKHPIGVVVDSGTATIGIGTTSNAYGERYTQDNDPTTSDGGSHTVCDGDLWYDTSDAPGQSVAGVIPIGGIILWSGTIADIPTSWALCNGGNGTPDLRDKFIIGAHSDGGGSAKTNVTGSLTQSGGSKDAVVVTHTHASADSSSGSNAGSPGTNFWASTGDSHFQGAKNINAPTDGVAGTDKNLPPYYSLAYIMRTS